MNNDSLLAFPMHGQLKLLSEGYRTRDGHLIEWFARLNAGCGPVAVLSRPEPHLLRPLTGKTRRKDPAPNTRAVDSYSWHVPKVHDRRSWWVQSRNAYVLPNPVPEVPSIIWNPLVGISNVWDDLRENHGTIAVDLLDDWTTHYAFQSIRSHVEQGYRNIFEHAELVTANAEGTLDLAHRFGRSDAVLLTNGVDPGRFEQMSTASGRVTVGYVGKIGKRVNLKLVEECAKNLPDVDFVFAGPILDKDYRPALEALENVKLLGDVHYENVPQLLKTFDIGWVPHNVGEFEVGGDVIKTYEYRAAHLPVLSTPVAGAGQRELESVYVVAPENHASWLKAMIDGKSRIAREHGNIPTKHTWKDKAEFILSRLNPNVSA
ncbi:glycosyltransferase [Pseudarthrobacter sp. NPDC058119]|uniref:glycosyltransferase n=1 Tax=Pseudarthrobacter sp. NPDC058119 TaxID=3346348 RepID=UPI0036DCDCDA